MRKGEKGWRKVIRSWSKYCQILIKVRNSNIALNRYNQEMDNTIKPTILKYYKLGFYTNEEKERLLKYINTQRLLIK